MIGQVALMFGMWRPVMGLILASVVIMGSPGSSTISATAMGAAFGVRRSLKYVCGLITGTICVLLAVSAGVVALMLSIPHGARVLGGISAIYIAYMAFKTATAPPLESRGGHAPVPAFVGGFLLAIANPKAYLAIAAVFAGTTIVVDHPGLDAVVKITLLGVMIVIIHICWLLAGASLSRVLHDPVSSRLVNVSLAAILVTTTLVTFIS
jgi:threonine/homoserine/homoserine lactone efflux protein